MKKIIGAVAVCVLLMGTAQRTQAVELLVSGDFETPGGAVGEVPGWELQEALVGTSEGADTASILPGDDSTLWLKGFAGGGPLGPLQGNFDNDNLPGGDVDGRDFLYWQRGLSPTPLDAGQLGVWQANYGGTAEPHLANARLIQRVPAVAGETYTFQGTSEFEEFYSGFVTTLGDASPHGQIASPTTTQFKMEFLNSSGQIIGTPTVLDLRPEQTFPGFPVVHTPLVAVAPAGTANVRVVAEALNMAWNGSTTQETPGNDQSAFFNDFILTRGADPGTNLLENGDLNAGIPDALDFWNQIEVPSTNDQILRTPVAAFSNHTPGGTRGVWLSGFFGAHMNFEPDPVDGIVSQTVQAVEGGEYTFSGWTKFEGGFSGGVDTICTGAGCTGFFAGMTSPTETFIKIEFFDESGPGTPEEPNVPLATSEIDVKVARRDAEDLADDGLLNGTGTANDNVWREHELSAIAPAGTRFIKLTGGMLDAVFNQDVGGGLGNQSAFFDDFSLDGPAPPALVNITVPEPSAAVMLVIGALVGCVGRTRRFA